MAFVDNRYRVECILDPGCQVIIMSASRCNKLGLAYDSSIRLNMQLANGSCNLSLGLACNVPFLISSLIFYLQVHIVQSPAYDVLLGRPFNILTESIIRNFAIEDQTITIHDPNTRRKITIPTVPRSTRCLAKASKATRFSMIRESIEDHSTLKAVTQVLPYQSLSSISQLVSAHPPISSFCFATDSISTSISSAIPYPMPASTPSDLISDSISTSISSAISAAIPSPSTSPTDYFNSISYLTLSNSNSKPTSD
jgi:hypothetical protein